MPKACHEYEPSFLCDLLDGLDGCPGSMYRAHMLEHPATPHTGTPGGDRVLQWMGYSQDSVLLNEISNNIELLRVMFAGFMGAKKAEPDLILPPGSDRSARSGPNDGPTSFSTAGKGVDEILGMLHAVYD